MAVVAIILVLYVRFAPFVPPEAMSVIPGTVVLGADGTVLQRDTSAGLRIPVTLEQVAPIMADATIAAEDQRFRQHPGVDPIAISRALATERWQPSGASTITQQLARRLYLRDSEDSLYARKLREALIALQIEAHRSKDEILALYLNDVYYGRGAYGVEAAARVYFATSARGLDLAEAAMLAGLPQLPGAFDGADLDRARARQRYVLDRLVATGKVTRAQADEAAARQLAFGPALASPVAPHFIGYALDELARLRPDLAGRSGLVIETTLDAGLQREAERSVSFRLSELRDKGAGNAAVVALDPSTGGILAMVGSAAFEDAANGGQINMAVRARQPGSALKPFLYLSALEHGFTAASPLLDVPTTFQTPSGPYSPLNYDRRFHGVVPLRVALASSYNVPAVRMLERIGIDAFLEVAHRFGLRTLTDSEVYGLALTLGGGEVRLLDLVGAYGAFARDGELVPPVAITRVRDAASGAVLFQRPRALPTRVASREHAYILTDVLADPLARIPAFGEVNPLDTPFRAAVKTGTTTGFRDNWAVGFTPDRVVGVWVGNTDGTSMDGVSGVEGAAPIWRDVIAVARTATPGLWPAPPAGLVSAEVCAPTGLLPGPECAEPVREWFMAGTEPQVRESYYARGVDGKITIDPPVEARAWAVEAGLRLSDASRGAAAVHIVQPGPDSVLYLSPELAEQAVLLKASGPPGTVSLEVRVDGAMVGHVRGSEASVVWRLALGSHRIDAVAHLAGGTDAIAQTTFEVRGR